VTVGATGCGQAAAGAGAGGGALGTLAHAASTRQIKATLLGTVLIKSRGAAGREYSKRHTASDPASWLNLSAPSDTHEHDLVPDRGGRRPVAVDLHRVVDPAQTKGR